jgi:hypothetical protein
MCRSARWQPHERPARGERLVNCMANVVPTTVASGAASVSSVRHRHNERRSFSLPQPPGAVQLRRADRHPVMETTVAKPTGETLEELWKNADSRLLQDPWPEIGLAKAGSRSFAADGVGGSFAGRERYCYSARSAARNSANAVQVAAARIQSSAK